MSARRRLLPHPILSLGLAGLWLLLWNDPSALVLAATPLIAVAVPLATRRFWPDAPPRVRPGPILRLTGRLALDMLVANFAVARLALFRGPRVDPAWVDFPLALTDPFAITMLANAVTLTPGTLSAEITDGGRTLRIHCLHLTGSADDLRRQVRERYERLLEEAFPC